MSKTDVIEIEGTVVEKLLRDHNVIKDGMLD